MNIDFALIIGLSIPFLGTVIGSSTVFLLKNKLNHNFTKFLMGFASGVMIAACVWSLIIPSINIAEEENIISWIPASIGFIIGILFLLFLDKITPHMHVNEKKGEGPKSNLKKTTMLFLAVTLHNIPEGMAVGVVFAGVLGGNVTISLMGAIALAIGIAVQNFPEGAIISMPLKSEGFSKKKAFLYGSLSGIVEPISAVLTIIFSSFLTPILPYLLSFAAGAMMFVVVEELIPESQGKKHSDIGVIGVSIGFLLMMILDVSLG